jgi:hypothetical protein
MPAKLPPIDIGLNAKGILEAESTLGHVAESTLGHVDASHGQNMPVTGPAFPFPNPPALGDNCAGPDRKPTTVAVGGMEGAVETPPLWILEVPRQVAALTRKNLILARRNFTTTFLRTSVSLFFMLMIFLVNEGLKARYSTLAYFQDLRDSSSLRQPIHGIPECVTKRGYDSCITFAYAPAPWDEFSPAIDYAGIEKLAEAVQEKGAATCGKGAAGAGALCSSSDCSMKEMEATHACAKCCELLRVHRVVRSIMAHNGSSADSSSEAADATTVYTIPASRVLGFTNQSQLDAFLTKKPEFVQAGYLFSSPHGNATTFMVQHNSTPSIVRGTWQSVVLSVTVPMQVTASRAIATEIIKSVTGDPNAPAGKVSDWNIGIAPFAHPPQNIASFESQVAPLFLAPLFLSASLSLSLRWRLSFWRLSFFPPLFL